MSNMHSYIGLLSFAFQISCISKIAFFASLPWNLHALFISLFCKYGACRFHLFKIFVVKKMPKILAHSGTPDELF